MTKHPSSNSMKNLVLALCIFVLFFNSCENPPLVDRFYDIVIVNNSVKDVRVHRADLYAEKQYPDTSLPVSRPALLKIPASKRGYFYSKTPWEENLNALPSDTLSVFFIDNDLYEQKNWSEIRDNYLIIRRYDFSIEDLKRNNYTIVYP